MTSIEIEVGVRDTMYVVPKFDPSVLIEMRGDNVLVMEIVQYLKGFTSSAGEIEMK